MVTLTELGPLGFFDMAEGGGVARLSFVFDRAGSACPDSGFVGCFVYFGDLATVYARYILTRSCSGGNRYLEVNVQRTSSALETVRLTLDTLFCDQLANVICADIQTRQCFHAGDSFS